MERQYIFFRSGGGLLTFAIGIVLIMGSTQALQYFLPENPGLVISVAVDLFVLAILFSFKLDSRAARKR